MKTCDFIETEKLTAYVDGELNDKEMQEIAEHIKTCESCRNLINELEELSQNTLFHYEQIEAGFELPNLMRDLNEKLKNMDNITEEHTKYDNIIEFPKEKIKKDENSDDNIFGKVYKFAPAIISLAAILLISIIISNNKPNVTTVNTQAKATDNVTVDSLEYSKFNAMIYKTKDKNKTVIWLFKENNNDDDDGPI